MINDVMLHFDTPLDKEQQQTLQSQLAKHFGIAPSRHSSSRPHLYFFAAHPLKAPPHEVLRQVRIAGFSATLVDM